MISISENGILSGKSGIICGEGERTHFMCRQLFRIIGKKNIQKMVFLLLVMFFGAFLEMLGISLIVSVCAVIVNTEAVMENTFILRLCAFLGIKTQQSFLISMVIVLLGIYGFKMLYLILEYNLQSDFVKKCRHEVSIKIFTKILYWPYERFIQYTSSEITNLIYNDANSFAQYLRAFLNFVTEVQVAVCMSIFLFLVNPKMTIFCCLGIIFLLLLTHYFIRYKIIRAGKICREMGKERLKWLNQAARGMKDIKISRTEEFFSRNYKKADQDFVKAEKTNQVWSKVTALCSETILMFAVLLYIFWLIVTGQDLLNFLPGLSALSLVIIRLLPASNRINNSLSQMSFARHATESVYELICDSENNPILKVPETKSGTNTAKNDFRGNILARNITFHYSGHPRNVLQGAGIEIPFGSSVGIVGLSGAGKTTLVDVLLGLLEPVSGAVTVDGVSLKECYASFLQNVVYIPQTTFLLDDTVRSNVGLGMPLDKMQDDKVWSALEAAALSQMVRSQPDGLDTMIGEGGIRLSGGERQRLGIARAMYRGGNIMVFDEATSALDQDTEAAILESIYKLKGQKTLIIISHRASAVAGCDRIYRVADGKVTLERKSD